MLADLTSRYAALPASDTFERLYADDMHFGHIFATLHERLNQHFDSINGRIKTTKHYWADASRDMLALIDELEDALGFLKVAGFRGDIRRGIPRCRRSLQAVALP